MSYVLLEDGLRLDGEACGAPGPVTGEVVFNTAMTGYQESMTDPSYAGQLITFTYPHIGNYGVSAEAMESERAHARGAIMRDARNVEDAPGAEGGWLDWLSDCGVAGITGVDTRALVRHIRDRGAMRGGIFPADFDRSEAARLVADEPNMNGRDLAASVTPAVAVELAPTGAQTGPLIAVLDTGIKGSIVANLRARGARVTLLPCDTPADAVLERKPDAVFLANGPGDPAALDHVVEELRNLVGRVPVYGICLGHQLLCRAVGLETYKLPFGHRGANHPVKDLATGRIEITSQNHGFAVLGPDGEHRIPGDEPVRWQTNFGAAELTHINLYDRTVEGLRLCDVPGWTVQYHPEAGPGPHDAVHLFDRMIGELTGSPALRMVREMLAAVNRGRGGAELLERFDEFYDTRFEWRPAVVGSFEGRAFAGREGFAEFWADFEAAFDELQLLEPSFEELPGGFVLVSAVMSVRGQLGGVPVAQHGWFLWRVLDGRVVSGSSHLSLEAAMEAAHA